MNNIQPRHLARSIIIAVTLMFCLGMGVISIMLLGRGEGAIEEAESEPEENTACGFTVIPEQLMVYQAPIQAHSQEKAVVPGGETYPIIKQNTGYYLLQLTDDDSGWVNSQAGATQGDCNDIPLDETSLADFPTVCAFTNSQEVVLYSEPELVNSIGTVPSNTYLIESAAANGYYIVLNDQYSGWVAAADGEVVGACQTLPGTPG